MRVAQDAFCESLNPCREAKSDIVYFIFKIPHLRVVSLLFSLLTPTSSASLLICDDDNAADQVQLHISPLFSRIDYCIFSSHFRKG